MTSGTVRKTPPRGPGGKFISMSKDVVLKSEEFEEINKFLGYLQTENFHLSEALQNVQLMVDEKGWTPLYDYDRDGGLSISQLHAISRQLRELVAGNPLVGNGSRLRSTVVWGGGLEFSITQANGKQKPVVAATQTILDKPKNLRTLFSPTAQEQLEKAAYTDGNLFILGDDNAKTFQRIPISEIHGDLRNPDDHEEVWAFRRAWMRDPYGPDRIYEVRWYYTDYYEGPRQATVRWGGSMEPVDRTKTLIHVPFNGQVGWVYGVADALCIIAWSRLYKEFLVNGYVVSKALAQFIYKVTSPSANQAVSAAIQVAMPGQQAGSTASMTEGQELDSMATAGKGYDFASGRAIAAQIAAGIGVSVAALTGDSQGAGIAEATLDPATKVTAAMRRRIWNDVWTRIFRFLGVSQKLNVTWHDLPVEQIQRIMQAWTLTNNSGLFKPEIMQAGFAEAMSISNPGDIPDGYLEPNNAKSLPRLDIDTDATPGANPKSDGGKTGAGGATGGTGQGQGGKGATGGKGSGLGNDHSTD